MVFFYTKPFSDTIWVCSQFKSAQFSRSVVSNFLRLHRLKHTRLSHPSPTPGAFSNSGPSNWWPPNYLILWCPLLLQPSIFPSIRVFPSESFLPIRWLKYWSFNFSISSSNEYSGLISFMIDWFELLAVQGTLKSLLQHHSWKASILQHSAFFIVQLSHLYMTTGKTIALTRWTSVGKVMSLLFSMLSRFSSKEQASFNFMAAVTISSDFGVPKNKVSHGFHCFPICLPWSGGTGCHDLNIEF